MKLAFFSVERNLKNLLMSMFHCACAIQQGEQNKNDRLDHRYQDTQAENGQWSKKSAGKHKENTEQDFFGKNVSEKTHGE